MTITAKDKSAGALAGSVSGSGGLHITKLFDVSGWVAVGELGLLALQLGGPLAVDKTLTRQSPAVEPVWVSLPLPLLPTTAAKSTSPVDELSL